MGAAPTMSNVMLWAILVMTLAFWMYSFVTAFLRVRTIILDRERHAEWAQRVVDNR